MTTSIPKYIQELMKRSQYEFDFCTRNENYAAGYTISIRKDRPYQRIETLRAEVQRLQAWVQREYKKRGGDDQITYLLSMPARTHYCNQYAIVTIFDPIMKDIEGYIKNN